MKVFDVKRVQVKNWLERYYPLFFLITLPILGEVYNVLNHPHGVVYSMVTPVDRLIPFNKFFILPYLLWSPFIFLMLFYFFRRDLQTYYNVLITLHLGMIINYVIFVTFQTTVPRPEVLGSDLWSAAVRRLYALDRPFNCFPSGHVETSWMIFCGILHLTRQKSWLRIGTAAAVMLITASTFFLKQHTILDAAASVFLGSLVWQFVTAFDLGRIWAWTGQVLVMKKETGQEG